MRAPPVLMDFLFLVRRKMCEENFGVACSKWLTHDETVINKNCIFD